MTGPWEKKRPAAPHKLLNAYIDCLADFHPLDADDAFLSGEPDVEPIEIGRFEWGKIEQGATILCRGKQQLSIFSAWPIN